MLEEPNQEVPLLRLLQPYGRISTAGPKEHNHHAYALVEQEKNLIIFLTETLSSSSPVLNVKLPKRVIIFATKRNLGTLVEVPNWIADQSCSVQNLRGFH